MLTHKITRYLSIRAKQGLIRTRIPVSHDLASIQFNSNDYLSLRQDVRIKRAYSRGLRDYPTGAGGSSLVCGYHPIHQVLEQAFADALSVEACLLFPSGYVANLSVIQLLAQLQTHILIDKSVHASVYDGIALAKADYSRFSHNNITDCLRKLIKPSVLITEAIFSMSGQRAPLKAYVKLNHVHFQALIVDEAHSFGVCGPQGLGAVAEQQLTEQHVPLRIIPLGKAAAGVGAIVAGSGLWIEALLQAARSNRYTTAISPAYSYGLLKTFEMIRTADDRRTKLQHLVNYFRQGCQSSGLRWGDSYSPIQQLQLGCPHEALQVAHALANCGIICTAIRQPTVTKQQTGLRIVLNYHHEPEHIDNLFACLHRIIEERNVV